MKKKKGFNFLYKFKNSILFILGIFLIPFSIFSSTDKEKKEKEDKARIAKSKNDSEALKFEMKLLLDEVSAYISNNKLYPEDLEELKDLIKYGKYVLAKDNIYLIRKTKDSLEYKFSLVKKTKVYDFSKEKVHDNVTVKEKRDDKEISTDQDVKKRTVLEQEQKNNKQNKMNDIDTKQVKQPKVSKQELKNENSKPQSNVRKDNLNVVPTKDSVTDKKKTSEVPVEKQKSVLENKLVKKKEPYVSKEKKKDTIVQNNVQDEKTPKPSKKFEQSNDKKIEKQIPSIDSTAKNVKPDNKNNEKSNVFINDITLKKIVSENSKKNITFKPVKINKPKIESLTLDFKRIYAIFLSKIESINKLVLVIKEIMMLRSEMLEKKKKSINSIDLKITDMDSLLSSIEYALISIENIENYLIQNVSFLDKLSKEYMELLEYINKVKASLNNILGNIIEKENPKILKKDSN